MTAGLPTRARPESADRAGIRPVRARASEALDEQLLQAVRALAQSQGTDVDHVVLSAYLVVQSRYTGEPEAGVGIDGADLADAGQVIRVEIDEDSTFAKLVARVRDAPGRQSDAAGPVEVVFGFSRPGRAAAVATADAADAGDVATEAALRIALRAEPGPPALEADYDTTIFDPDTVRRLLGHLRTLLAAVVADPESLPLADAPLLTEAEQRLMLLDWNATAADLDHSACLHERFAARATADPAAPVLIHRGVPIGAGEINVAANQLAQHLKALGVGVRTRVALCVDRGPNLLTAILGVLKAGGAYVPLDADYPAERLEFMQRDSACEVLITESHLLDRLPEPGCPVVLLDRDAELIAGRPVDCPAPVAGPDDLCYVIYTSGSTGHPKGIALRHRGVLNNLLDLNTRFGVGPGDSVLALSSTSFDMSVYEFLGITLAGGAVVVPDADRAKDPAHWHELIQRHRVTVWNSAPALAELYTAHVHGLSAAERTGLRLAMLGGDWVLSTLPDRMRSFAPAIRVIVMGGATESSIHSTIFEAGAPLPGWSSIPYGRPMANQRTYILDARRRPVPIGVPGELHLAGVGLAEGYLGRPELTAEKFFETAAGPVRPNAGDPIQPTAGDRLYRTGDLARFGPDGLIELLGRIDFQTKIRGLRVELGEIEALLRSRPEVAEAVVCVGTDAAGDRFLAGYLVASSGTAGRLDLDRIRARVARALPDYMVPAVLTELDHLPVTPNGKLDRAALIRMAGLPRTRSARGTAPTTEPGIALAELWCEVLGLDEVFLEDGFLALGGHSLKAVRLASRIRENLGVVVGSATILRSADLAELAAEVRRAQIAPAVAEKPIERRGDGTEAAPLSFAQERLWYLDQLAPGSPSYNVAVTIPWRADLDISALRRAIDRLIEHHEGLRTRFAAVAGLARQIVDDPWRIDVPVEDVGPDADAFGAAIRREAAAPFDLAAGRLIRARLIRADPDTQALALTLHHIITDGWSLDVLFGQLERLYAAETGGGAVTLAEPPIRAADHALWQRNQRASGAWDRDLAYWREQLASAPTVLELPSSRVRPAQQSFRGGLHSFSWDRSLHDRLAELGRGQGATVHMIVVAAFSALLGRLTGRTDVVVGMPVAMRNRPELEPLLGFLVNTLPLRVDLAGDPTAGDLTVADVLGRVRDAVLGAVEHPDLPFERLVEAARPDRDPARMPLVQFMVQVNDVPLRALHLGGHRLQPRPADPGGAKADLVLIVEDRGDGLEGSLEYNGDIFDEADATRFADQLRMLLEHMSQEPETRLGDLRLLDRADEDQLLRDWNQTGADIPDDAVHRLFEEHADSAPDRIAVIAPGSTLTYRELDAAADRVAHRLYGAGVRPGDRVGICLNRSPDLIAAMLGILKAGAAYVPLDPEYPAERLAFMAGDAGLGVIVTEPATAGRFELGDRRELLLDPAGDALPAEPTEPAVPAGPADPATRLASSSTATSAAANSAAYVIYTSGSTGRPKGVVVDHRAIVRLVRGTDYIRIGAGDRVAQAANASFDAITFEVWGALANGGCVVMLSREVVLDPAKLAAALAEHDVTSMFLTTAAVNAVAYQRPDAFSTLRELLFGGEAVDPRAVRRILEHGAPQRLVHVYGPTETTTFATWHEVREVGADAATVPIGRPIANTEAYVLDNRMRPVPVGMPGELFLGGPGVAAGYLGRPALTAERFVPHPFTTRPGERLYRTGDRVRFLADGAIEFLGRRDGQVKIRGYRIETGEIESALSGHPAVVRAAVVVDEPAGAGRRLAAFVETAAPVTAEELRDGLRRTLPDHLVPAVYVLLDSLPITPNGKVDRAALQVPAGYQALAAGSGEAPASPVEEILTGVFAEVLGLARVPADGDFFELGGHSLLAIPLLARINEVLGTDLPIRTLLAGPSPRSLAGQLSAAATDDAAVAGPILRRVEAAPEEPVPLSFAQQRLWFMDQLEPDSSLYNVPLVLRLRGDLDRDALHAAFSLLIQRHEVLRTSYPASRGRPRQRLDSVAAVDLPYTDLAGQPDALPAAERLAAEDAVRPFDLADGPVFRARLVRTAPDEHRLSLVIHHIAVDGWSLPILWHDLGELYAAQAAHRPHQLPESPVRYSDYARWQREWLADDRLAQLIGYWRGVLGDDPAVPALPTDHPRPAMRSFAGAVAAAAIDDDLADRLRALGRHEGATEYMVLLAAFQVLLAEWTGNPDITVGTPMAGRGRPGLDRLVGCLINMLPVRTSLADGPDFRTVLARVRRAVLGALAHEDLPFDRLVEALVSRRDREMSPLFRTMFNYVGDQADPDFGPAVRAGGELRWTGETAMFDLGLVVEAGARSGIASNTGSNTGSGTESNTASGTGSGVASDTGSNTASGVASSNASGTGGLRLTLQYATDLFTAATADTLLAGYLRMLTRLVGDPDRPVWEPAAASADSPTPAGDRDDMNGSAS